MKKLVDLCCARFKAMSEDKKIKYVFIFENRGDVVGATMPHPHGQMYGYSVVPKKIELDAAKEHYDENGEFIFCRMSKEEYGAGLRIIHGNDDFAAYIPSLQIMHMAYILFQRHIKRPYQISARAKKKISERFFATHCFYVIF